MVGCGEISASMKKCRQSCEAAGRYLIGDTAEILAHLHLEIAVLSPVRAPRVADLSIESESHRTDHMGFAAARNGIHENNNLKK
jgi:hypothetical protein